MLCAGLTSALLALGAWNAWAFYAGFRELASNEVELMRLNGEILHLDEVLTMSARMAAATGDARWEQRYDRFDSVLVSKLAEAIALAPEAYGPGAAGATDEANVKLVAMERAAFDRVRMKDRAGATKLLFSDEYERQKRVYSAGMQRSRETAQHRIANRFSAFHRRAALSAAMAFAVLLVLGACWLHIGRMILRHLGAREQAEAALREANSTMERKVADRTAALGDANDRLQETLDHQRRMQRELVSASRKAGMADVARTVLHNVGNVLNSLNVSATMITEVIQRSRVSGLLKVGELLKEHKDDIGTFMTTDARGRHVPEYLWTLSERVQEERRTLLNELESLQRNVDHIKSIIARQQLHTASTESLFEVLRPEEVADEAIELVRSACDQEGIVIKREYALVPAVSMDRHRTLQILVNLIQNARQALVGVDQARDITVRIVPRDETMFAIEVEDTGCGIAAAHGTRLFEHGFTTKRDGHGLGLHSSACLAKELGGSLGGMSAGPGQGACFTLVLPMQSAAVAA